MFIEVLDIGLQHALGQGSGSFGLAIIVYTCILKSFTFPLFENQIGQASKMKKLIPKIKDIQDKYQNDQN